jgi:hypothetical protein
MTLRFTWHRLIKKPINCANTIGTVITERNIFTPLPRDNAYLKAVASRKGNRLFTG